MPRHCEEETVFRSDRPSRKEMMRQEALRRLGAVAIGMRVQYIGAGDVDASGSIVEESKSGKIFRVLFDAPLTYADARWDSLWASPQELRGPHLTHLHHCPHCYEAFECASRCTIEPDLADRGRDFGAHAVCSSIECLIRAAADKYNERFEARCRESLRRLRSPPPLSGRFWGSLPLYPGTHVAVGDLVMDGDVTCVWDGYGWQALGG